MTCLIAALGRRLLRLIAVLGIVALAAFGLMQASPVDPVDAYLGAQLAQVSPEQRALIAERWGVDQPAVQQFRLWLGNLLRGELGWSRVYNAPVGEVIGTRFLASLPLLASAWLGATLFGFILGVVAGTREDGWADRWIRRYAYTLASTPTFWLAILALLLFSVALGWTPVCCAGPAGVTRDELGLATRLHHLLLPALTLSLLGVAQITLHTRARMLELMRSEIALHAFAQGASRREVAWRHGARHACLPALTLAFASLGELFGGAILVEQVFAYPGLGRATVEAGLRSDVPLLLAIALFTALFVSLGNALADGLYRLVDPRLREAYQ
ncbi:ABC transporter permease [Franzmannia qiaohouensis]|uniref:ABC transporter permease n=1 Tax=Franzmannia qiaohouensis TaxID=1329370 RepID=A0ABU1HC92_9GAMM|nr:ABC transporter permease [Halomonas qiaohouensis]MDR5904976.1 ABC transporter permease [Halomonas qiaohouensis]